MRMCSPSVCHTSVKQHRWISPPKEFGLLGITQGLLSIHLAETTTVLGEGWVISFGPNQFLTMGSFQELTRMCL